jgi:cyclopropane fatty-acyl-phospholipid synthase-like methyltransferase
MKQAMKNITGSFSGFLGGAKTNPVSVPVKIKPRTPDPSELLIAKYNGDPSIVAKHAIWGKGRIWPQDQAFEEKIPSLFNFTADKIVGVLGCGTGAALLELSQRLPCFIHGYDWRQGVESAGTELIRNSGKAAKVRIRSMCLNIVLASDTRCHGIIALEPVLTRAQPKVLDWLRLALVSGGQAVLVEPSLEESNKSAASHWFKDTRSENCFWQSPGERSNALKQAGFDVRKVKETTGSYLRSMRKALSTAHKSQSELDEAIKLAPILEPLRNFFSLEVESAKNRLRTLETGAVAVYRYQLIKQRADG